MRQLEIRRHARRDPNDDRLSAEGREQARELGEASRDLHYDVVFVSPAKRAAETAAWFLRGAGHALPPDHHIVPALAGRAEGGADADASRTRDRDGAGLRAMIEQVPDGGRGLAFGHTPLVERAVEGLTGIAIEPLHEGEGVLLTRADDGTIGFEELRASA